MTDLIPAIRGNMGGREYYIGKMTFQEIASKVQFYDELQPNRDLDQLLQRQLSKRSMDMINYLLRQPERFYGAIIVAAWGGRPTYIPVKMEDHPLLNDDFEFGLLKFDGRQEYFALDGQHRLRSIKEAIEQQPELRHEEISVIFVTHEKTEEGNIKTRRLFHTLNRYARPTTTGENIALDEDNVISISTRMLLKSDIDILNPSRLELVRKNVSKNQQDKFTTLSALYEFNAAVLDAVYSFKSEKDYLRYRPDAHHVDNIFAAISSLWIEMANSFEEFRDIKSKGKIPGDIREPEDAPAKGHLFFRPVGLRIFGEILGAALAEREDLPMGRGEEMDLNIWTEVLGRVKHLPLILGEIPWRGTIFRNNKMEPSARQLSLRLACYMLSIGHTDADKLLEDYRGHLDNDKVMLPEKLFDTTSEGNGHT